MSRENAKPWPRCDRLLDEFGHDPRPLGWHKRQHMLEYEVLLSHWNLDGANMLDFGCGFGDSMPIARKAAAAVCTITGWTSTLARSLRAPSAILNAELFARNAVTEGFGATYDVIVASGIYNSRLKDNWDFVTRTFAMFAAHSREGFAVNFLSNRVACTEDSLCYADPPRVLDLCYSYSRRVLLRQDYCHSSSRYSWICAQFRQELYRVSGLSRLHT